MKELVIISGKGGTGKTSLTGSFAALATNNCLCDADVDAADLHLLLDPTIRQQHAFLGGSKALIIESACSRCGLCIELCQFGAITDQFSVDPVGCEGCGVCVEFCPDQAIAFLDHNSGDWYLSDTRFGPLVHARLGIGEENSGKLVSLIRRQAREVAASRKLELIITDGPPGIGCPVIASISGATAVTIIVEPTVSGIHDMQRVAELLSCFKIPGLVCINKCDLNPGLAASIENEAQKRGLEVVGRIPFDPCFTRAMVAGMTVVEFAPGTELAARIGSVWQAICSSDPLSNRSARMTLPTANSL